MPRRIAEHASRYDERSFHRTHEEASDIVIRRRFAVILPRRTRGAMREYTSPSEESRFPIQRMLSKHGSGLPRTPHKRAVSEHEERTMILTENRTERSSVNWSPCSRIESRPLKPAVACVRRTWRLGQCGIGPGAETWCAREAGVNAGESPAGAVRRFSTEDRANCVAARRGGEPFRKAQGPEPVEGQAWSRTGRSQ